MSTEEVVVKFYDAICEYGRPGRLGKTFQTKKNYYFLDAGTGKVAQIRKTVYEILTTLLESDDVTEGEYSPVMKQIMRLSPCRNSLWLRQHISVVIVMASLFMVMQTTIWHRSLGRLSIKR